MVNGPMAVNAPNSRINPAPMRASLGGTPSALTAADGAVVDGARVVAAGAGVSMVKPLGIHRRNRRRGSDAIGERSSPDAGRDGPHCHCLAQHRGITDAFPKNRIDLIEH